MRTGSSPSTRSSIPRSFRRRQPRSRETADLERAGDSEAASPPPAPEAPPAKAETVEEKAAEESPQGEPKIDRLVDALLTVLVANGEYIRQLGPDEAITVVAFGDRRFELAPMGVRLERALEERSPAVRRLAVRGGPRTRLVMSMLRSDLLLYLNGGLSRDELAARARITRY